MYGVLRDDTIPSNATEYYDDADDLAELDAAEARFLEHLHASGRFSLADAAECVEVERRMEVLS